ncbi:sugar transferase [Sinomonas atrocyanea]|uniref:sugar transferase n=1 Tax=Sinomonas atrocyanea TaxID=37927 RepID=UPI002865E222|nr:sugar transferase [Sinomonas atrocyanea]MDR6620811.1 exopolysaccharide biosynthesis polyprenyl glycosylphosphotransferase [Sinomonas atrocyanea]
MLTTVFVIDLVCVCWAVVGAQILRFGAEEDTAVQGTGASYFAVSVLIAVGWWLSLGAAGSRNQRILGHGLEEYRRVARATFWFFGAVAIFSYVFRLELARGYVAIALPLGLVGLLFARWSFRARLVARRNEGLGLQRVLLVGAPVTVRHLARQLGSARAAGYMPVAAYVPDVYSIAQEDEAQYGIRLISGPAVTSSIVNALAASEANAVAISNGAAIPPRTLQELGWQLSARNVAMIVAPALTDVAGPRIHTQPIAGLPLIHVTTPKLDGFRGALKRGFDIVGSGLIVLVLSPVLLGVALAVRLSSPGPVLYSQARIGQGGEPFKMYKFRSMVTNADAMLGDLLRAQGSDRKPLFKVENDPRITKVGGILRRYSLDELPQLFNVLLGSMSLVGPRPQREAEVALYDDYAHRRLIVKPGMSGLWQVSGRSNLTWEQAIRFDLYYVDNWSLLGDLIILAKTFKAVVAKDGAV